MNSQEIDLHIHSYYSDGTMAPEEIMEEAIKKNLKMIAIADHNVLEGSKELLSISRNKDIECFPAVEIDTIDNGVNYHILAYNFDIENQEFNQFVNNVYFSSLPLENVSELRLRSSLHLPQAALRHSAFSNPSFFIWQG